MTGSEGASLTPMPKKQTSYTHAAQHLQKYCYQVSLFHTIKYGETRVRTKFKFVSKTEIKSRLGKRANQENARHGRIAEKSRV